MPVPNDLLSTLFTAIQNVIDANAEAVTELDQAIGDGDHVYNLQRGLQALQEQIPTLSALEWQAALQKIGMTLMSTVGGASGSLYGTLFISMSKNLGARPVDCSSFADIFAAGVESMKQRGKADVGEKTMLDVLIPVAQYLQTHSAEPLTELLPAIQHVALKGVEATRDMLATKGRASFLGERSRGCIDAGAQTAQLMINAIAEVLIQKS